VAETGKADDVGTRDVPDPIVMVLVQVFAELRYGVVAHTREDRVKYGLNFNQTP
jgi:hypothetical protein